MAKGTLETITHGVKDLGLISKLMEKNKLIDIKDFDENAVVDLDSLRVSPYEKSMISMDYTKPNNPSGYKQTATINIIQEKYNCGAWHTYSMTRYLNPVPNWLLQQLMSVTGNYMVTASCKQRELPELEKYGWKSYLKVNSGRNGSKMAYIYLYLPPEKMYKKGY